ncbi:cation:proton antiporter [Lutibaculum baratangense]|uniref:Putative sodium/hydrogen exchanger family n=1 Tax=Lutibaculum baratangense AMV1 TaxID=631454 RepID=V4RVH0_9HYPH|nr:cation:proton antiporter [Lutibaculum baratangense]ESR27040.1 putative sodium/hydrogen exchanger family [Lutibaculum baratangense AMV1]
MNLPVLLAVVATLFVIIALSEPLAARLRLPYTVMLAAIGMVIGSAAGFVFNTDLTDLLNPVARAFLDLPVNSAVFLYMFLPTLLFQVALGLNIRRMLDDWVPILVMAVVAVVVATFAVGFALLPLSGLSLATCLLIGAIVSTTDPSAVVSIFRDIAAPQRLTRIVEGESLLNDAAAIALFSLFLAFVMAGVPDPSMSGAITRFPLLLVGGAAVGYLLGRVGVTFLRLLNRRPLAQVSISLPLPYLTYILSEQVLQVSGVIAVVAAAVTINLLGPGRLSPAAWTYMREVWDLLAHWAGSLIFVLAALLIPRLLESVTLSDVALILVVTVAAIAARAAMLFGVMPLLSLVRLSPRVERSYRVAILWGGLRGAVTLALALAVTENAYVPPEAKRLVGVLATGFVLFTLIVQGTTLRWVIRRLGLDRLSPLDAALSNQVIAVALQNVREDVAETARSYELTHEIVRSEAKAFGQRLDNAVSAAEDSVEIQDRDRITLGLVALAGRERDLILEQFRQQVISSRLVDRMLSDVDRLIERTRAGGRTEYRSAGRRSLGQGRGRGYRLAAMLHNRLGISRFVSRMAADRFEILLGHRLILRDLHGFIDMKIRRIHGRRVADLLHEMLQRRLEETERALEALRLQYPGYAEELERRFLRRTALRLEEREYGALLGDGLIGQELYATLLGNINARRAQVERRPPLDLALHKAELIRRFPLFANMTEEQRGRLARGLQTIFAAPGDVLMRRDNPPERVFFIASGAVELETAGQTFRLGRGDMFGQLRLLAKSTRRSQATAIAYSTLLSLDDARFLRLLKRNDALREAVERSAIARGSTPAAAAAIAAPGDGDGAKGDGAGPAETGRPPLADAEEPPRERPDGTDAEATGPERNLASSHA